MFCFRKKDYSGAQDPSRSLHGIEDTIEEDVIDEDNIDLQEMKTIDFISFILCRQVILTLF